MSGQEALDALFADLWEWRMKEYPEMATFCGDHRYDDRLNVHTEQTFLDRKKVLEDYLSKCRGFDQDSVDSERLVSLRVLTEDIEAFLRGIETKSYVFALCNMEGIHIDFEQLTSWMEFKTIQDYRNYTSRLEKLSNRVDEEISVLQLGIDLGKTFSVHCLEKVPTQLRAMDKKCEETTFYKPFTSCESDLGEEFGVLAERARELISSQILPAFRKLLIFIEQTYLPACRPTPGVIGMSGGKAFYEEVLLWHISANLTPQEVHNIGIKEVARIKAEMKEVLEKIGFKGDLKEFFSELKTNDKFYFNDKEELLSAFRKIADEDIRPKLPQLFHKMPKSPLSIVALPASRTGAPAAFYLAGTLDGSRDGKFFVNASDLRNNGKFDMMTLALHEGEPGHHFQGMYAVEATEMPSFRRYCEDMYYGIAPCRFGLNTAYGEGWGLYCEFLGKELGLYEDPYSLFGHLSFEMFRACRLMADTGLHYLGWSFDEAVELFLENTALTREAIISECNRYCSIPGQACAYKIGQIKIQELRKKAQDTLGAKFDVRDFHEEVLRVGMVPMGVLEYVIDAYIEKTLQKYKN